MWGNKVRALVPLMLIAGLAMGIQPAQAAPAAPKAVGDVQLVTLDDSGISHTIRYADGSWQGFGHLTGNRGYAYSGLTSAIVNGEEHVFYHYLCCGQPYQTGITHLIRHFDGTWNLAGAVPSDPSGSFEGRQMAVANVNGVLHLVDLQRGGAVRHSSQNADGTWSAWDTVPITGTSLTSFGSLSVTGNGSDLRLVLSTTDGTALVETDRHADGTWSTARQTGFGNDAGTSKARNLSVAQVGDDLEVVALDDNYGVYHSIMHANGSWDPFRDVSGAAGYPGQAISIAAAASRGALQLVVGTSTGGLMHTIRFADGSWQRYGDVEQAAGRPASVYQISLAGQ